MDFLKVVGSRRSIRWFRPWQPVEPAQLQRVLEVARLTSSPGNLQPWRAAVIAADLDEGMRSELPAANNQQPAQQLAPVWVYWYGDPEAVSAARYLEHIRELLPTGAIPAAFGWSEEVTRSSIEDGTKAPAGLPALEASVHGSRQRSAPSSPFRRPTGPASPRALPR